MGTQEALLYYVGDSKGCPWGLWGLLFRGFQEVPDTAWHHAVGIPARAGVGSDGSRGVRLPALALLGFSDPTTW